jgi:hypothetical protein
MQRVLRFLLPVFVLVGAFMVARALMFARPQVAAKPQVARELPVTVLRALPAPHPVELAALGEVKPVHRLVLQPEVSGRVIERSPSLMPGGLLHRGEPLLRVDNRDHATVVAAQAAAVEQAHAALAEERTRKQVAEYEWQGSADKLSEDARRFALRETHGRSVAAGLSSAKAQFEKARRDLGRTQVKVPFDALVLDASVELGQLVTPQSALATLVAIDRYWVEVAVPVSQLIHFDIPGVNREDPARRGRRRRHRAYRMGRAPARAGRLARTHGPHAARGRGPPGGQKRPNRQADAGRPGRSRPAGHPAAAARRLRARADRRGAAAGHHRGAARRPRRRPPGLARRRRETGRA